MAAHQAPSSLGFSRQEHWSGLPFPYPMHEWKVKVKSLSCAQFLATPWTAAHQAPLSMGFSRLEYWSVLPYPPTGDLPNLGIETASLISPALAGGFFITSATWEAHKIMCWGPKVTRQTHNLQSIDSICEILWENTVTHLGHYGIKWSERLWRWVSKMREDFKNTPS